MIESVYTPDLIYTTLSEKNKIDNRTVLVNCSITQTTYGSVIITRPTHTIKVELYPSVINQIIHRI